MTRNTNPVKHTDEIVIIVCIRIYFEAYFIIIAKMVPRESAIRIKGTRMTIPVSA